MAATFSQRARSCSLFVRRWAVGIALAAALSFAAPAPACPQLADLNGDEQVDVFDLLAMLAQWGPCPQDALCPADLTNSGSVDVFDLLLLLSSWGPAPLFDYGPTFENQEAVQIGIEMLSASDPPTLPVEVYDRIVADLRLIRDAVPFLQDQEHQELKTIDRMMIQINPMADLGDYNCLNAFYGVTNAQFIFSHQGTDFYELHFPAPLNVAGLAEAYLDASGVLYANSSVSLGFGTLVFWLAQIVDENEDRWSWTILWGEFGCTGDFCPCSVNYTFETTPDGDLALIDFASGDNEPPCPAPTHPGFD